MAASTPNLPWPRVREPSLLVRRLVQLLTLPPIIFIGVPLSIFWNILTFLMRRPTHSLRRHILLGAIRFFQGATSTSRFVMPADSEADVIPKAALKPARTEKAEYAVRTVPPVDNSVPRLPCTRLTPAMDQVVPIPTPLFAIAPKGTPDIWAKATKDEMCIFYIVGGGYQLGHPLRFPMPTEYSVRTGLRLFAPNYRKCLDDASGYPAPLYDMLAGLQFVIEELGFEPKNIILIGESAGGHAVLMVSRYMDDLLQMGFTKWGVPGGVFASAPWTNMLCNFPTIDTNYSTDWLAPVRAVIAPAFNRHCGGHLTDPTLSPALAPSDDQHWKRLQDAGVLMHVDCGTDEVLYDDGVNLVKAMRAQGLDVQFREFPGGVHCEFAFASMAPKAFKGAGFSWPHILGDLDDMVAKLRARV